MKLDDLARGAVSELLDVSAAQAFGGLVDLQRRRRHRAVVRGASAVAVLVLIAAGLGLANASKGREVQPAESQLDVVNGALLGFPAADDAWVTVLDGTLPADSVLGRLLPLLGANVEFSPDSTELRYYEVDGSEPSGASGRMVTVDLDSGRRQTVWQCADDETLRCGGRAALSPDGRRVALLTGFGNPRLEVTDLRTGEVVVEPGEWSGQPSWSPDGALLAVPTLMGISIIEPGSGSRLLVPLESQYPYFVDLSWSPDGNQVAYVDPIALDKPAGWTGFRLMVADVATGTTRELQDLGRCLCKSLFPPQVAWSPDGRLIATSTTTSRSLTASGDVLVMRPDGSNVQTVGVNENLTSLVWQPVPAEQQ